MFPGTPCRPASGWRSAQPFSITRSTTSGGSAMWRLPSLGGWRWANSRPTMKASGGASVDSGTWKARAPGTETPLGPTTTPGSELAKTKTRSCSSGGAFCATWVCGFLGVVSGRGPGRRRARKLGSGGMERPFLVRKQTVAVARRLLRREPRIGDVPLLGVLWRARVVAGGGLVGAVEAPRAVFLELPRARAQEHARAVARADERVPRLGRAVDEVPLLQGALLPLDDEQALTREDEEVLLLRLPVIRPGRLAGVHDPDSHAEHREERLRLVLVVARERDAVALLRLVEPARLARVHHEPAGARGNETGAGVFESCLGNHRPRWY